MRLEILESGHRPMQRMALRIIGASSEGGRAPGPIATMSYNRELYGKHLAACIQQAMRKATEWTVGEVELFAAFVSDINKCDY